MKPRLSERERMRGLPSCPQTRESGGFTLLEVLLAVGMTAIVVTALYSSFFLSRKAVDAVDDSLLRLQECRSVLDVLKREIESSVYDPAGSRNYTVLKIDDRDFYGKEGSQLVFTSFSPLLPGLSKIAYTVEENEGRLTLKKKIDPAYGQSSETKGIDLIENIGAFTVEAKYNDKWVKTWDSGVAKGVPEEIRISVQISAKKEESPLVISEVARPRIGKTL